MKFKIAVGIGILVIGIIAGYGIGYFHYVPKINDYKAQVAKLTNNVTELTTKVAELNNEASRLNGTITSQSTKILNLESEKTSLQSELVLAEQSIDGYRSQVDSLTQQTSSLRTESVNLQTRMDKILGVTVVQHYDWLNTWTWEMTIPISLYMEYKQRPRPTLTGFVNMAKDPKDDSFIDQMIQFVDAKSRQYNFTEQQRINYVITFVQSLPYTSDSVTEKADEYPRYPVETLFDRGGDCEDTAILVAALLDRMGYDVALINPPNHMAVGIALPNATGRYYTYSAKKYYYLETTGEGWKIGEMPSVYINMSANVYPLR
jgi:predicted transglutaminase-like cysteine proteinase